MTSNISSRPIAVANKSKLIPRFRINNNLSNSAIFDNELRASKRAEEHQVDSVYRVLAAKL